MGGQGEGGKGWKSMPELISGIEPEIEDLLLSSGGTIAWLGIFITAPALRGGNMLRLQIIYLYWGDGGCWRRRGRSFLLSACAAAPHRPVQGLRGLPERDVLIYSRSRPWALEHPLGKGQKKTLRPTEIWQVKLSTPSVCATVCVAGVRLYARARLQGRLLRCKTLGGRVRRNL